MFLCKFIKQSKTSYDHHVYKTQWFDLEAVKELDCLPGTNEVINIVTEEN